MKDARHLPTWLGTGATKLEWDNDRRRIGIALYTMVMEWIESAVSDRIGDDGQPP